MKAKHSLLFIWILLMTAPFQHAMAQDKSSSYMRMAKITVDSTRLSDYLIALKTQMQAALKNEKGVLAYAAVQDKKSPHKITIMETYASMEAYQSHILTEHFKKYKAAVADMVKELELTDVTPIAIQTKLK